MELQALFRNIRLEWIWLTVISTLAYHAIELNIRVQKFYKTGPALFYRPVL